jgi:hypothetical protein
MIELSFVGIPPALRPVLSRWSIDTYVEWQDLFWDILLCLDAVPRNVTGGYICECCPPENRTLFPDRPALWRDHLFEPFLDWVNTELAPATILGLYKSPGGGVTWAKLVRSDEVESDGKPDIAVPLRSDSIAT